MAYKRQIDRLPIIPKDAQEFRKASGEALPADYWDQSIKYQSSIASIAERREPNQAPYFSATNFELRSAGPDLCMPVRSQARF
jgi:hypothetical protein